MVRSSALLLLLASLAAAEEVWIGFGEREWKSSSRRLVVNKAGFRFFEGENLIAEGQMLQLPFDVHVLANEAGAVLFEKYAAIGEGDTLAFLGADGKLRWRLTPNQIPGGAGDDVLRRLWWVDEARGKAVLVARSGALLDVDLTTGKVANAAKEGVLVALPRMRGWAFQEVLEIAVETQPEGLREVAEKLLADGSLAPVSHLLAAVAVEKSGGAAVTRAVWDAALEDDVNIERRRDAVAFAGAHIADLSLVEETAVRKDFGKAAMRALDKRDATGKIEAFVMNGSIDPELRAYAAELLGRRAPGAILEAIDKEMEDADAKEGGALLGAAIASRAPDLERRLQHHEALLLKILDKETGDLYWLAGYFKGRPTSEAVQPLLRSLARHKGNAVLRKKLISALRPCSGEDYGDDADAWIKALAKR